MLIDWFTVGAQALNFLVLIWLLRRFLYQPVLDAIDAREARIARQIADAETQMRQAQEQGEVFAQQHKAFEQARDALLQKATQEAQAERQRLLDQARAAAQALGARQQAALRSETEQQQQALGERVQHEAFALARHALRDLAQVDLEARVTEVFLDRLRNMAEAARADMAAALQAPGAQAVLHSAFELNAGQRSAIQAALSKTFQWSGPDSSAATPLRFATEPRLVGGIELVAGGQKLAWNMEQYLAALEQTAAALLVPAGPALPEHDETPVVDAANDRNGGGPT
ncbi:F0F1 ATP synthase subunit B [Hydrogenophaga sp.]|uniref:F0F1 ATP synthase subunit B family protein n=1 Tax=Hydrogenophaga sp. TaxID=1904254 RepID=UPI0035619157